MNELMIFNYGDSNIRTVEKENGTWWVLKDVCGVLDLGSPHKVADRLDDDERNLIPLTDSLGRQQETTIISESGLYSVILRSDKEDAKTFRRWVTHEVLPAIRKQGYYSAIPTEQLAKIVLDGVNDEWKLENVIIPALRDGKVEQSMLVAKYMGLTADEFGNNPKILKKSNDNRIAKNLIDGWKKRNRGVYSEDDIPAPYKGTPFLWNTIHKMSRSANCYGMFARYCGIDYFNIDGLSYIADHYVKNKIISESDAQSWIDRVLNHDNS